MSFQINQGDSLEEESVITEVPIETLGQEFSTIQKTTDLGTDFTYTHKILWINAIVFTAHQITALMGFVSVFKFGVNPLTTIYMIILVLVQFLGLTMGAHRYFTHRSFKANTILRRTLIILFVLNGHHSLWRWVRDHRQHHKYADTDGDPHNATRGFTYSHFGWLLTEPNPKVIQYRKLIDTSDIEADPWIMFHEKHYFKVYLVNIIITCILPIVLWNESTFKAFCVCYATRTFMSLHMVSSVNSLAHIIGNKPYDKSIGSTQNKFAAFITYGEGWHNFHHTFPQDYRTSELGAPFSWTTNLIDYCAKMGWVYDRKEVTEKTLMSRIIRTGDNSHEKYGFISEETKAQ